MVASRIEPTAMKKAPEFYDEKEAQERFERALRAAFSIERKQLREIYSEEERKKMRLQKK